jgi:bifunctional enzyme CysN/CysC
MIVEPQPAKSSNVVWHATAVSREQRPTRGLTVWFTGLSGAGKSTLAVEVERRLVGSGHIAYLLDGDNLRHGINADLGFGAADRGENVRRVGEVARLFADAGIIVLVSLISPYRGDRGRVRAIHERDGLPFIELFMDIPLEVCEARDPKGLYARVRAGEITGFTGIDDPYEPPEDPELVLRPRHGSPSEMADWIIAELYSGPLSGWRTHAPLASFTPPVHGQGSSGPVDGQLTSSLIP